MPRASLASFVARKRKPTLRYARRRLFRELEEETGQPTGYIENGSLGLALTEVRDENVRRSVSRAKYAGFEAQYLSPAEIAERFPYVFTDDLWGAYFVPGNGQVNPVDVTNALAKGARNRGVRIIENLKADRIITRNGVAKGVVQERGGYPMAAPHKFDHQTIPAPRPTAFRSCALRSRHWLARYVASTSIAPPASARAFAMIGATSTL